MSSTTMMPCIGNSGVFLTRLNSAPILVSNSRFIPTIWRHEALKISPKDRLIPSRIGKGLAYGEVPFMRSSSGCLNLNLMRRSGWRPHDSLSSFVLRTFASSSEGSNGNSGLWEKALEVEKVLQKGVVVKSAEAVEENWTKPEICTADELHYVPVPSTNWRLALWRYLPSPNAPKRNHPVLMLSGIGTNAIGFDLDPSVSMARCMAGKGFDTWILEVRGAGLSKAEDEFDEETEESKTNGAIADDRSTIEDATVVEYPKKTLNEPSSVDRNSVNSLVKEEQDVAETENGGTAQKSQAMDEFETDSPSKISDPINKKLAVADREDSSEFSLAYEGVSREAWKAATRVSNLIMQSSEKLRKLLTVGQSKSLSDRFIDSVSSLLEDNTLSKGIVGLRERLTSLLRSEDTNLSAANQIADLRRRLAQLLDTSTMTDFQERLSSTVDDFQKVVDLIAKYDWDFDNYLEEDVPAAMDYIRGRSKPVDGKMLAIGHSMGGIVLYAQLSSRDPVQILNVPVVPLGALMSAAHPLVTRPPYALVSLGYQISAQNMMRKEHFSKLVLNNFGTIPMKLLLHLITVFQPGGLTNRDGTVKYQDNIPKVTIPVLAVAGDQDLICPSEAVQETVNLFKKETITYKCYGDDNRHYGHYDVVCSPGAKEEVFPDIADFLVQHDEVRMDEESKIDVKN